MTTTSARHRPHVMKWVAMLAAAFMVLAAACAPPAENGDNGEEYPVEVEEWIENVRQVFAGHVWNHDGQTYILVSYGERPTAGYDVTITDVSVGDAAVMVTAVFSDPAPGESVAQVITYPHDIHVMDETALPVEFAAEGEQFYVPMVLGLDANDPLPIIVAASEFIKVFGPAPEATVGLQFALTGMANVFEGNVVYHVRDADENVIFQAFTTAAMGDWGTFAETVELPGGTSGEVLLRVWSPDASDGEAEGVGPDGEMFLVEIPLNVVDSDD